MDSSNDRLRQVFQYPPISAENLVTVQLGQKCSPLEQRLLPRDLLLHLINLLFHEVFGMLLGEQESGGISIVQISFGILPNCDPRIVTGHIVTWTNCNELLLLQTMNCDE